jgi:hypothetical protein
MKILTLALSLMFAQSAPPAPPAQDPHAQMHARGNHVMGFDQDKTAHHFFL